MQGLQKMIGAAFALVLLLSGCAAPQDPVDVPSSSGVDSAQQAEPENMGDPQGFRRQSVTFSDAFESVGGEVRLDESGALLPPATNVKVSRLESDTVTVTLLLPENWTLRTPQEGSGTYAAMLRGPVNLYQDGRCIGTIGYDRFDDQPIEHWDEYGFDSQPEDYQGYYRWLMAGSDNWDNDYTPVVQTETTESATCRIRYSARRLGTDSDRYTQGILAYNRDLLCFTGIELLDGAATDEQLRTIAQSIEITSRERPSEPLLPAPTVETPFGYADVSVAFPAYQNGRADYNAEIYDLPPFELCMALPQGWSVREPAQKGTSDLFTPMELWQGERCVGWVGFNTFEVTGPTTEENFHRMIYSALMLGSVVNWDNDYTPVAQTETTCTATCRVMRKDTGEEWAGRMPDAPASYTPAILSYDEKLLVYVALEFAEGSVTDEQLLTIAHSVRLRRD